MQSAPGLPLMRSLPSGPVEQDEVAPLAPDDSRLAAASAATRVVSAEANRILFQR
jgi:hypothetical protein